jgi:ferredoxin
MKTAIYYFTGTGNSLSCARELSSNIPDSELIPMAGIKDMVCHAEKAGFIFPLYYWGIPEIAGRIIRQLDLSKTKYLFYILISGGLSSPHRINGFLNKIMKNKNKKINFGYRIVMPSNYISKYDSDDHDLINKKIRNSRIILKSLSDKINNNKEDVIKDRFPFIAGIMNNLWKMNVNKSDRNFFFTDKCNSCSTCQNVCPVNNITMINGHPVWNNKCQECMACIQFCPRNAIQSGNKTENRIRYHHPDITVDDIINQKNIFI